MFGELFDAVNLGPWTTIGLDVQIKLVGKTLFIQGSVSRSDWIQNFKFWKRNYRDVYKCSDVCFKAHTGFAEMWMSIKAEIEKLDFDTIVGYSQGAAIAGFVHENYLHRFGFQPMTYTFGMPRILFKPSKELKSRFASLIRIKNPHDIVTMVPTAILGYRHIGVKRVLSASAKKPAGYPILEWMSGHCPEEYRQRLEGK